MRRLFTLLLTLVLGLGPSLAAIPANALAFGWGSRQMDESRLPACCRRNGAHHCAMKMGETDGAAQASNPGDQETSVAAADSCPCMPRSLATTVTAQAALVNAAAGPQNLLSESRTAQSASRAAGISQRRTWPKRGPPILQVV